MKTAFGIALALSLAACVAPARRAARFADGQWIAHRGDSAHAPENTLAAVRSALALEPPPAWIEVDVHRSADGELVVIHDATLDRTTRAQGAVAETPWSELAAVDAGFPEGFGDAFRDEPLPRLADVLDAVRGTGTGVMIEVKARGAGGPAAALVRARGEEGRHVLASFHADVVVDASLAAPDLPTLFLVGEPGLEHVELARRIGASILGVGHESTTSTLVDLAHREGLAVWAWTVDDEARARGLRRLGVDGVISNDLPRVRR